MFAKDCDNFSIFGRANFSKLWTPLVQFRRSLEGISRLTTSKVGFGYLDRHVTCPFTSIKARIDHGLKRFFNFSEEILYSEIPPQVLFLREKICCEIDKTSGKSQGYSI